MHTDFLHSFFFFFLTNLPLWRCSEMSSWLKACLTFFVFVFGTRHNRWRMGGSCGLNDGFHWCLRLLLVLPLMPETMSETIASTDVWDYWALFRNKSSEKQELCGSEECKVWFWTHHSLAVRHWARYLTSLWFSFPICKQG